MKRLFVLGFLLLSCFSFSQDSREEQLAKKLIQDFFEAFHAQDSSALKEFAHPDVKLQSIAVDEDGKTKLTSNTYHEFLKGITSIPEETTFEEVLHDFNVSVYGKMASVATPYSFYLNEEFSHCGVNSFQLMKEKGEWKIIYLVDTRTKTDCDKT